MENLQFLDLSLVEVAKRPQIQTTMVARVEIQTLAEVLQVNPEMVAEVPAVQRTELCLESASHQISVALHLSMAVAVMEQMVLEVVHREIMRVKLMPSR
jgi:predicted metallopeptidase